MARQAKGPRTAARQAAKGPRTAARLAWGLALRIGRLGRLVLRLGRLGGRAPARQAISFLLSHVSVTTAAWPRITTYLLDTCMTIK